jgi:hypothetical protein
MIPPFLMWPLVKGYCNNSPRRFSPGVLFFNRSSEVRLFLAYMSDMRITCF